MLRPLVSYFDQYLRLHGYGDKIKVISDADGTGKFCKIEGTEECSLEDLQKMYDLRDSFDWNNPGDEIPNLDKFKQELLDSLPPEGIFMLSSSIHSIEEIEDVPAFYSRLTGANFSWTPYNKIAEIAQRNRIKLHD